MRAPLTVYYNSASFSYLSEFLGEPGNDKYLLQYQEQYDFTCDTRGCWLAACGITPINYFLVG